MIKKSDQTNVEINNPEHEKLIEVLKFTPRTYKIQLWGYGGEYSMGTVDRKIYDYFRKRRLSVVDFAWDSDYAEQNNIPEDMWPFTPGSWYECEDMGHVYGVDRSSGTMQILDENDEVVYERSLDDLDGCDVQLASGDEVWIDSQPKDTVVFFGYTSDKGTFFEAEFELKQPFDPEKLCITTDDFDGNEIVTSVQYDEEELCNNGGDTNGKGSDFAFYIAGSNRGHGYTRYRDMDDIKYTLTAWFSNKQIPPQVGLYNVQTKEGHEYQAMWTGDYWHNTWDDDKKPVKIKQWQGIAYDPDEHFLREELDNLVVPDNAMACSACGWIGTNDDTHIWDGQDCCPNCGEPITID